MSGYSYKDALRAKGILPLPPYSELRSAGVGAREILNPALAKSSVQGVHRPARSATLAERSAT